VGVLTNAVSPQLLATASYTAGRKASRFASNPVDEVWWLSAPAL